MTTLTRIGDGRRLELTMSEATTTNGRPNLAKRATLGWIRRCMAAVLLCAVCPPATIRGELGDQHTAFLEGLWQRQLYRQAEFYCQTQLDRPDLDEEQRAALVVHQIRAYARHAMNATSKDRAPLWDKAAAGWHRFREERDDERDWPDVALQYWLAESARGQMLRLEAELTANQADVDQAIGVLRGAIRGLKDLERSVAESQRQANSTSSRQKTLNLQTLRHQIQFKLAEASYQQALCYPRGTPNAIHLLTQARDLFGSLAQLAGDSDFTWQNRLELVACQRRLGHFDAAERELNEMEAAAGLPSGIQQRLDVARARWEIDRGAVLRGVQRLAHALQASETFAELSVEAEAEVALIGGYVQLAREATRKSESEQARQWQAEALARLRKLEQSKPPYWVRRAETLLGSVDSGSAGFADVEVLARSAANQFRRRQFDDAIRTFQRAAALARELDDSQRAFELDYQAAAISYQNRDLEGAREAFRQTALGNRHAQASDAHLMAITCAARLARGSTAELARYETLLQEHLRKWSTGPSVDQSRFWLAKLHQQRHEWSAAINSLTRISSDFPQREEVHQRARACYLELLRDDGIQAEEQTDLADQAAAYFERPLSDQAQAVDVWDSWRRSAVLNAATFRLLFIPATSARTQQYLEASLAPDSADEPWTSQTRCLLGVAYVLSRDVAAAKEQLSLVNWSHVDVGLEVAARLDREFLSRNDSADPTPRFSQLICEKLQATDSYDAEQKRTLSRFRADALGRLGDRQQAIDIYVGLSERDPNDVSLLRRLAEFCEQDPSPDGKQRAMDYWRRVVRLSNSASTSWFQAKLAIARIHLQLGNSQRAEEVIRLTEVLHPNLGGPEFKQQFASLLSQCKAAEKR